MKIERKRTDTFYAKITLGTQVGYSKEIISEDDLISYLQYYKDTLIKEKDLFLSACLTECKIILSGQIEPHYQLSFINYPRFRLEA
jgi:hypothetical protein